MKLLISIPVFNRQKVTELVLENIMKYKKEATLWVYNDWSTEYDNDFLEPLCDKVIKLEPSDKIVIKNEKNTKGMGVQHLRWHQLREFDKQDEFDAIYFTDSDALHDPDFIDVLINTYNKYRTKDGRRYPLSLYDTIWHSQKQNNLREGVDVWMRRTAPGISQFYDKEMVKTIVEKLNNEKNDPDYGWDYRILDFLKNPILTTKTSYIEHFGASNESMHTKEGDWDRDRAVNPTDYLKNIRNDVINYLEGKASKPYI